MSRGWVKLAVSTQIRCYQVSLQKQRAYLQLLFDAGLSFLLLFINFTSYLSFAFFLCSKIFRLCDLMLVHTRIVLTKCTTWPQKHTTWSTTAYITSFFPLLFVTYHPHESLSAFLESCQNLNAVCPCYIPLFFGTVLIFLCVLMIDSFLFLFFCKKKQPNSQHCTLFME